MLALQANGQNKLSFVCVRSGFGSGSGLISVNAPESKMRRTKRGAGRQAGRQ